MSQRRSRAQRELTAAWWGRQRAVDDDPPPHFADLRDFEERAGSWTEREEADYLAWVEREAARGNEVATVPEIDPAYPSSW